MLRTRPCPPSRHPFLSAVTASMLAAVPALAQTPTTSPPDPGLARRIEALEQEVAQLRATTGQPSATATTTTPAGEPHYPDIRVTGFFQLDAGYYLQNDNSVATLGDINDALGFRRARLAATGKVAEHVSFIMEFDAAQAQPRFVDVWMQFDRTPLGSLRVGRFRQPFGMDELTSVRDLAFLERGSLFPLSPFRQTGVQLADTAHDQRLTYAVAGYRYVSDNYGNVFSDTGGYGGSARLTGLVVDDGDTLVHVGAAYSHNSPGLGSVRFATQNEFFGGENPVFGPGGLDPSTIVAVPLFVDTGALPASRVDLWNVEAAASWGPVVLQAEARWARVDMGAMSETFPAAYAQARWVLTGETIPYVKNGGVFGRVRPAHPVFDGGAGALELAGRVSYIDLDGANVTGPGRSMTATTVGLSWYLNDHTKLQFNWLHDELDDRMLGTSRSDTLALRAQIDF